MANWFRSKTPPAAPVPVDPNAAQFGYVEPPPAGSGFMDQYRYINQTSPDALMQLGAGMIAGDVAGGFSRAADVMQQGRQQQQARKLALYGYNEGQKKENLTRQWLKQKFPDATDVELDAAIANPAILSELLAPPAKRNLVTVGDRLYDADTGEWITPEGGAGGFDLGTGTDARALEYLVTTGVLTERQAAEVAGGKSITLPDGMLVFKGASDLAGNPTIITQPPGEQPVVVDPDAPAVPAVPAVPAQPGGGAGSGGTILSPPKSTETTEERNKKSQAKITKQILFGQLDAYTALVKQTGIEAASGANMDKLNIARNSIIVALKDLATLGALTGPDLELVSSQIYDPIIDLQKKGPLSTAGQIFTGTFGDPGARAESAAKALKEQIEIRTNAALGIGSVPTITTQEEYNALPSGAKYISGNTGLPGTKP